MEGAAYEVVYTKHKRQKRKVWHDGRLEVKDTGRKIVLKDDEKNVLDSRFLRASETIEMDAEIELDMYLVSILSCIQDSPAPQQVPVSKDATVASRASHSTPLLHSNASSAFKRPRIASNLSKRSSLWSEQQGNSRTLNPLPRKTQLKPKGVTGVRPPLSTPNRPATVQWPPLDAFNDALRTAISTQPGGCKLQSVLRKAKIRVAEIKPRYQNLNEYKSVFSAAITEFLNMQLLDMAYSFYGLLWQFVTLRDRSPFPDAMLRYDQQKKRLCYARNSGASFIKWADSEDNRVGPQYCWMQLPPPSLPPLAGSDLPTLQQWIWEAQKVRYFTKCKLRTSAYSRNSDSAESKKYFLTFDANERKRCTASMFDMFDIWVLDSEYSMTSSSWSLVVAMYHGISSRNSLEVRYMGGRKLSSIGQGAPIYAMRLFNCMNEHHMLDSLKTVTPQELPLLPYILGSTPSGHLQQRQIQRGNGSSIQTISGLSTRIDDVCESMIRDLVAEYAELYTLNPDQYAVLEECAAWLLRPNDSRRQSPIVLVHGVFGAGKSTLLQCLARFLDAAFTAMGGHLGTSVHIQILVTSLTNVAVDRVLLGLVGDGFTSICRVGSVQRMDPELIPYAVNSASEEDFEVRRAIRELKDELNGERLSRKQRALLLEQIRDLEEHKMQHKKEQLGAARVVGCTLCSSTFPVLNSKSFPIVFVDEVSQTMEPLLMVPLSRFRAETLLLVGDPLQLRPTISVPPAPQLGSDPCGLEQNMYKRLSICGNVAEIMLRAQYRCHPCISSISSHMFYGDRIRCGSNVCDRSPLVPGWPAFLFVDVSDGEAVWDRPTSGGGWSLYNRKEADWIVKLISTLSIRSRESEDELDPRHTVDEDSTDVEDKSTAAVEDTSAEGSDILPENVGVICWYRAQAKYIKNALKASAGEDAPTVTEGDPGESPYADISVSTVDAFQGAERDIIFISTVQSKGDQSMQFLEDEQRINVAITRARKHLVVVGNGNLMKRSRVWTRLFEYQKQHPDIPQYVLNQRTLSVYRSTELSYRKYDPSEYNAAVEALTKEAPANALESQRSSNVRAQLEDTSSASAVAAAVPDTGGTSSSSHYAPPTATAHPRTATSTAGTANIDVEAEWDDAIDLDDTFDDPVDVECTAQSFAPASSARSVNSGAVAERPVSSFRESLRMTTTQRVQQTKRFPFQYKAPDPRVSAPSAHVVDDCITTDLDCVGHIDDADMSVNTGANERMTAGAGTSTLGSSTDTGFDVPFPEPELADDIVFNEDDWL